MKSEHRPPDDLFSGLPAGVGARDSVGRQVTAPAVPACFFDRRDLFENPEGRS